MCKKYNIFSNKSILIILLLSFTFFILPLSIFSQENTEEHEINELIEDQETSEELNLIKFKISEIYQKRNLFADITYTAMGILNANMFVNVLGRIMDLPHAHISFKQMWENIKKPNWYWETGDRYFNNQVGHSYHGYAYFAGARISGFTFYESMLAIPLGSLMWEVLLEPHAAYNDLITTTIGGISIGEMLHRLFLEINMSSFWAKIGGFFVSPINTYYKMYNRPLRETGGGNLYYLSFRTGIEKTFIFFPEHEEHEESWKYPGAYLDVNISYSNPFIQESKIPYKHFDFFMGFSTNIATCQLVIITDGYLVSYNPINKEKSSMSTGLTLHYDFFLATNDLVDNLGYGNIPFSSNALGWSLKHKYISSEKLHLETKLHGAVVLWGNSMYNGDFTVDVSETGVHLGNTFGSYGIGENIKFSFLLSHKKAGRLDFILTAYHMFSIPVTARHSKGNVFFIHSSLSYDIPLGKVIGLGARVTYWGLFGFYDSASNVNRRLISTSLFANFKLPN